MNAHSTLNPNPASESQPAKKQTSTGIILALLLGGLGIHLFYLGRWKVALLYLFFSWTLIPLLLGLFDCFRMRYLVAVANGEQQALTGGRRVASLAVRTGGVFVIMLTIGAIVQNVDQKRFDQDRDDIIAEMRTSLEGGDVDTAVQIASEFATVDDAELRELASTARLRQQEEQRRFAREAAVRRQEEAAAAELAKISDLSWEEFDSIYNLMSDWTEIQKEEKWKEFKGKTVQWTGEVVDVDDSFGGLNLSMRMNRDTLTFDLMLSVNADSKPMALELRKGEIVTFRGELSRWGSLLPTLLKDGSIVK